VEFVRQMRAGFPRTRIFVSASTLAGRATAAEKLAGLVDGVFYSPVDYVFAVRRVLRALQPSVVVIAETEIWPNLFREVKRTGAALAMVNGRISDRALGRYQRQRWFFSAVLEAADAILVQTGEIRERFLKIGAPAERVRVAGNFKYDFAARPAAPDSPVMSFLGRLRPAQVWIAASTMPPAAGEADEDAAVLEAFRALAPKFPGLLLLWAPRKPDHFDAAARKLAAMGVRFVRRSAGLDALELPGVLLLDSIGELGGLFGAAAAVFMGGTLANRGGHNILEAALFAKPVIVGPHMENFQAIADDFARANAMVRIREAAELATAVERLVSEPASAQEIGGRALAQAEVQRGASARALAEVRRLYSENVPRYRPAMPWYPLAWLLARIWEAGARRRQDAGLRAQRRLDIPVIGVGNLTMGGTGKTPTVLRLAEYLKAEGRAPAILTRGYGRTSPKKYLTLAPGEPVSTEEAGDEPRVFARSAVAPVGIGADRYEVAGLLRQRFRVDVCLLDDGFQHLWLARNLDIVLLDALNPFGGGDVFPLGRLREPIAGLGRASAVVITRSRYTDLAGAVETAVRRWNPRVPVFRGNMEPEAWVEARSGELHALEQAPFARAAAFCGVGNPQSFRRTLENLGVTPVEWLEFDDHHRYRPRQLRRMAAQFRAAGAEAAVTTEKDLVNLDEAHLDLLAPLTLYWLKVRMTVEPEAEFMALVERAVGLPARQR